MEDRGSNASLIIGIVVVLLVVGGIWLWMRSGTSSNSTSNTTTESGVTVTPTDTGTPSSTDTAGTPAGAPMSATVTYTAQGFSPATVTIAKGGTVTFVDQGGPSMWVASNQHPSHTGYDGTSRSQHCAAGYAGAKPFDECGPGNTYSFTFNETGSWGYHNHMSAQDGGTIIVQ